MKYGKSLIAALSVLALLAGPAGAEFQKGLKAGVNIATLTGSSIQNADSITGFTWGVFVSVGLGPVALAPELLFSAKGYKYTGTVGSSALTVVNNFNYIDIPVLLKYSIIPTGPVRPYLAAGPALSILMSAKSKADLAGSTSTTDVKNALSSSDYSIVLDGGLDFALGALTLSADVRYAIGLADVSKSSNGVSVNTKNSVISILAGVGF